MYDRNVVFVVALRDCWQRELLIENSLIARSSRREGAKLELGRYAVFQELCPATKHRPENNCLI